MIEISIVILTFNSIKFIEPCLASVFSQDYQDLETIVVDNGSADGTVNLIKNNYPKVILIENKENLGAAGARNQGIKSAKGSWVLTLDCDVVLEKSFLKKLIGFAKISEESVGILQPKILNMDKKTIYSCGNYLSGLKRLYDVGKDKPDNGQFNISRPIFSACSAAALYRRNLLEEIKEDTGYFDERFFFLVEDIDLALRAKRKGWQALYYPEAACYHYGNSSFFDKPLRQFLCWRNRKLLLKKYKIGIFKRCTMTLFYDLPRLMLLFLTNSYVRSQILHKDNSNIINYGRK